jgi:murein DD-endopeptidase MepM/ murein hydrolase activator NlpD
VVGTRVKQGDIIGYVGMTGLASGNHLHYEMLRAGRQIDPLSVDLPAGDPVPAEDRMRWLTERNVRMSLLESIPGGGPVREAVVEVQEDAQNAAAQRSPW